MDKRYLILIILGGVILFIYTLFEIGSAMPNSLFLNIIILVFVPYGLLIWIIKNHKEIAKPKEIFKKDNELNTKRIVCAVLLGLVLLGSAIPVISYNIEKVSAPVETYIPSTPSTNTDNSNSEEDTTSDGTEDIAFDSYQIFLRTYSSKMNSGQLTIDDVHSAWLKYANDNGDMTGYMTRDQYVKLITEDSRF